MKIVYNSFGGRYCDSPRVLYERLRSSEEFEHTWLSSPVHQHTFPADTRTIAYGSAECVDALEAADVVISNDHIALDWHKGSGTTYLQTWHGTPLKRIHHDVRWAPDGRLDYLDTDVARWDHLLSPNRVSTPRLRDAFAFEGRIHETGYPRNDVLSSPSRDRVRATVRESLGIPDGTTAVLYTPTWRDDLVFGSSGPHHVLHLDLEQFTRRLGEDHILLLRLHNMVAERLDIPAGAPVLDLSRYPEVSDLYLAADLMITDYSSTMFDFAITGKPILLYTYDLSYYRDELRGFYFDLDVEAPGPLLETSDEVLDAVQDVLEVSRSFAERYSGFQHTFCHLEDGYATDRVLESVIPTRGRGEPEVASRSPRQGGGHVHA